MSTEWLFLNLYATGITLVLAAAIGVYVHYSKHPKLVNIKIPAWEYAGVTLALLIFVVNPVVTEGGYLLARQHQTSYREFLSGVELKPQEVVFTCFESKYEGSARGLAPDGSRGDCEHYFNTDTYSEQVWVSDETCTGSGDDRHCYDTSHWETRWYDRQRPYTTTESTWLIPSTVGKIIAGSHWLPANPELHRLMPQPGQDRNQSLPAGIPSGVPASWAAANARNLIGKPGPVVVENTYVNWILPSGYIKLSKYAADIARFTALGLLPDINHTLHNDDALDGVYFAGIEVDNPADWQLKLAKLNALVGSNLEGRVYVVLVDANKVSARDSHAYGAALTAYWQSPKFGKYALSQNGIIVVLGTKAGKQVDWAFASTGMPRGNELMLGDILQELPGTTLDAAVLFGDASLSATAGGAKGYIVAATNNDGALAKILWGAHKFQRVSMDLFAYLKNEVILSVWEKVFILTVNILASCLVWGAISVFGVPAYQDWQASRRRRTTSGS
jgi:hypothetical protein